MKILHMDTRPDWRGGQLQILLTLRGQRKRGHETQLMALRDSPLAKQAATEGISVHYIQRRFLRLRAALILREILSQQEFDIVHAHDPHALTAAWLARAHRRAALVASRRVALPLSGGWPGMGRYRAARRIIAVSEFVARTLIQSGIDGGRIAIVHDGVEVPAETAQEQWRAARQRWGVADDDILLGCVGYLVEGKRQDIALRAFAEARKDFRKIKLLIVGDGKEKRSLERLASELGIAKEVMFAGFVKEIGGVYRALDIFVFPAVGEALGTSLLLAMAHGLPCVAAASGGVPEIIESGKNGILVGAPAGDTLREAIRIELTGRRPEATRTATLRRSGEFAEAISRVLSDPGLAARIGRAARQTIAEKFSADALAEGTLNAYQAAMEHH